MAIMALLGGGHWKLGRTILERLIFCKDVTFGSLITYNSVLQVAFCGFGFYVGMEGWEGGGRILCTVQASL